MTQYHGSLAEYPSPQQFPGGSGGYQPPIPQAVTELYFRLVAAAITGYLTQRDSVLCDKNEIAQHALELADITLTEYVARSGQRFPS